MQGVDFFFNNRAHALKFISFVQSVVPAKYRSDKQLVSHDEHSATYNYKYTFSVEIVPICRVSRVNILLLLTSSQVSCTAKYCSKVPLDQNLEHHSTNDAACSL